VESLFSYVNDDIPPARVNLDKGQIDNGYRFLNLCKRLLNGKDRGGFSSDFTYCGANGMSMIDYLLCGVNTISKFIVSNFNTLSDHAPLRLQLGISGIDILTNNRVT